MIVGVDQPEVAVAALREAGMQAQVTGLRVEVNTTPDQASEITRVLASKGLHLYELRVPETSLEEVFLELTREIEPTKQAEIDEAD